MAGGSSLPARLLDWLRRRARPEARIGRLYRPAKPAAIYPTIGPLIALVLPVHNTPPAILAACLASIQAQTYQHWQLCIADDASETRPEISPDPRIRTTRSPSRAGIAAASNAALALATAPLVAFIDHDDTLPPHALAAMAQAAEQNPQAGLIFSDEDQLIRGRPANPYFKPGWNPDLLLAQNLVGHLSLYRRTLLDRIGKLNPALDGSQDWDLALRAAQHTTPRHVPIIAYHWRQGAGSFSAMQSEAARAAGQRAVQSVLSAGATAVPAPGLPQWLRVIYPTPAKAPLVSLIAPTDAILPQDSAYPRTEHVTHADHAAGEILVFLAPHLRAPEPGWLRELVSHALRPEIGAAGPRIDAPDGRIAHSGLILDPRRIAQTLAPGSDAADPGYRGHFRLARTVSALSLDCLVIRRRTFRSAGGLDAGCGPYQDADLALRLAALGLRCVWTPHASLAYTQPPRTRHNRAAARVMRERWGEALNDPYLNPSLKVRKGNLARKERLLF